jgi:prolyl 4-hydroxylase
MIGGAEKRTPDRRIINIVENEVLVFDDFLDRAQCNKVLEEHVDELWFPSELVFKKNQHGNEGTGRQCELLAAGISGISTLACIERLEISLRQLFGIEPNNLEPWQLVRYGLNNKFDYHHDFGAKLKNNSSERKHSILIVIQQPQKGGATHFRALRKTIRPVVGRLIIWRNFLANGNCNYAMIHSGRPVWRGKKTILVTWEHDRAYRKNKGRLK